MDSLDLPTTMDPQDANTKGSWTPQICINTKNNLTLGYRVKLALGCRGNIF